MRGGPFTNYVDKSLAFFDHLLPCVDIFYSINVDIYRPPTYLPRLVNVVCERPQTVKLGRCELRCGQRKKLISSTFLDECFSNLSFWIKPKKFINFHKGHLAQILRKFNGHPFELLISLWAQSHHQLVKLSFSEKPQKFGQSSLWFWHLLRE